MPVITLIKRLDASRIKDATTSEVKAALIDAAGLASDSEDGLMSSDDKTKLDGLVNNDNTIVTADRTVTADENGTTFINTGASVSVELTLPAAVKGMEFGAIVDAANILRLRSAGSSSSVIYGITGIVGQYIEHNAIGAYTRIKCFKTGIWHVIAGLTDAWTVA